MQYEDLGPEQPIAPEHIYYGENPGGLVIEQYEEAYPVVEEPEHKPA